MREIRLYGSEGGGAARSPYPYQEMDEDVWVPVFAGMTQSSRIQPVPFSPLRSA